MTTFGKVAGQEGGGSGPLRGGGRGSGGGEQTLLVSHGISMLKKENNPLVAAKTLSDSVITNYNAYALTTTESVLTR